MPELLTASERAQILPGLTGWALAEGRDALVKRYRFDSFSQAFGWMVRVALAAEQLGHHPEWLNAGGIVDVTLSTREVDGLTRRDVELAERMDRLAAAER